MHPVLARYLNLDAAIDTLHRDELGQVLKAEERPFAAVARSHPDHREVLLAARGKTKVNPDVQRSQIFLATHAALAALREDDALGPALADARRALVDEGASDEQSDELIASLVLEEAFGQQDEDLDDHFDQAFFLESLGSIVPLAALTQERVLQLHESFARTADADWRATHQLAAQCLFESAWSEGPAPINREHVADALDTMHDKLSPADRPRAGTAMKRLMAFLNKAQLVGQLRVARLASSVDAWELAQRTGSMH
jgi:hypothetical protein